MTTDYSFIGTMATSLDLNGIGSDFFFIGIAFGLAFALSHNRRDTALSFLFIMVILATIPGLITQKWLVITIALLTAVYAFYHRKPSLQEALSDA